MALRKKHTVYFGEHKIFITDANDGQNYENKTQVARNHNRPVRMNPPTPSTNKCLADFRGRQDYWSRQLT